MISKNIKQFLAASLLCCGIVAAFIACANKPSQQDKYTVSGTISGLADNTVLVLTTHQPRT